MNSAAFPAIAALVAATGVAAALFVPFVVLQYRRHGAFVWTRSLLSFGMLVYAFALLTYTLLPLPIVTPGFCVGGGAGVQLVPGRFVADILDNGAGDVAQLVRNPAVLQMLFNVGLFVPLGMFVRHVFRRGVVLTVALGLLVSLLIEVTQLTGNWYVFPCSYRLFDVDDLLANTIGTAVGVSIAPILRVMRGPAPADPAAPREVQVGRRLLAMVSDVSAVVVGGVILTSVYGISRLAGGWEVPPSSEPMLGFVVANVVPALVQLALVLTTGRTVGEIAVRIGPRGHTGAWGSLRRWSVGIGGYTVLTGLLGLTEPFGVWLTVVVLIIALVIASIVSVVRSRGHRGLAYMTAGWDVADERESRADRSRPPPASARPTA
ncbi:MAG: hypothetical protein RI885_1274 [Actinomycetota bacterium]